MCDPGNPAGLRGSSVVLGRRACQGTRHGICRRKSELIPEDHRTHLHCRRCSNVVRRRGTVQRSTQLLSPSTGPYSSLLSLTLQTKDHYCMFTVLDPLMLPV